MIPRRRAALEFFLTWRLVGGDRDKVVAAEISPEIRGSLEKKGKGLRCLRPPLLVIVSSVKAAKECRAMPHSSQILPLTWTSWYAPASLSDLDSLKRRV